MMNNYDIIASGSAKIIRCVNCVLRYTDSCPMRHDECGKDLNGEEFFVTYDFTADDSFCDFGEDEYDDGDGGFED